MAAQKTKTQKKLNLVWLYTSLTDSKEAEVLAHKALAKKLIVCANVIPNIVSIYRWSGKTQSSNEVILLMKTSKNMYNKLKQFVLEEHPYDIPAVLQINLNDINRAYLNWAQQELEQ